MGGQAASLIGNIVISVIAVELSGFATIASVMLGGALLGVVGAILAVPAAASVKVVMREVTAPRRARMAQPADPAPEAGPA